MVTTVRAYIPLLRLACYKRRGDGFVYTEHFTFFSETDLSLSLKLEEYIVQSSCLIWN